MDVDEKKAEQTWFDNCIDDMLMDEEQSLSDEEEDDYAVEEQQLPAIFANESLMVVQKPAGLACQGGTGVKYSVDTLLGSVNEFADYKLVHRLDRGTSGALVVAKSRLAAVALTRAFHNHDVTKKYIALLEGIPQYMQGTIHNPLLYTGSKTIAVDASASEQARGAAKGATTKYKVLKTGMFKTPCSLVSVEILTGRKHQIRAHCAQILGCPVYGDTKYGSANSTLYLHCSEITIPVSSRITVFQERRVDVYSRVECVARWQC
ncbi:hypothetical protein LPJ68_002418 [Coemansia sp. RSA 1086]|nr:hypothetical protein LPJ68_002418 [Coemansia sp. RSA 1086]